MKTGVAGDKNLEGHNLFVKFVRIFSVPVLNSLPERFLRKFMRFSSHDAGTVLNNVGSWYGKYVKISLI